MLAQTIQRLIRQVEIVEEGLEGGHHPIQRRQHIIWIVEQRPDVVRPEPVGHSVLRADQLLKIATQRVNKLEDAGTELTGVLL